MRTALAVGLLGSVSLLTAGNAPSKKHPFGEDDWAALRSAWTVAVAPNGKSVLYDVRFGGAKGPTNDEWRIIGSNGGGSKKLDLPAGFTPSGFTPDEAALYGSYKVNDLAQFAVFALKSLTVGSTPQTTVFLPRGIRGAVPSPDGSRYAILADPRPADELAKTRVVIEPDETGIYVVQANGTGGAWWCSDLKHVANGVMAAGNPSIAWSPKSDSLAVLSLTPKIGYHYVHAFIDICSASGSHRIAEIPNAASGVAWVDSGRQLAFLSTTNSVLTPDEVYTVSASGGAPVNHTPNLEASAVGLVGDAHGNTWIVVDRGVRTEIERFQDGALKPAYRWPGGVIYGGPVFSPYASSAPQMAFTVADPAHAANVAVPKAGGLRKITMEGDSRLADVALGPVRDIHWTSKEGVALEGIATFPAGYRKGKKYPFLVLPHGGPEANDLFSLDPFSRIVAGLGYVVLQPEYRGSTGYGDKFLNDIYQHFGDRAYRDVDSATDYAIAQGWADPHRLAIFGWSAGGFMTSWTVRRRTAIGRPSKARGSPIGRVLFGPATCSRSITMPSGRPSIPRLSANFPRSISSIK